MKSVGFHSLRSSTTQALYAHLAHGLGSPRSLVLGALGEPPRPGGGPVRFVFWF